jgi:DNA-binding HxlR family transcriptional regulator
MVGGKYKLRILWGLQNGWRRYGEIKKGLLTGSVDSEEIAPRVLSRELKTLLTMGMVERKDHRVFPLKVEYRLTRKGRTLLPIIAAIHDWDLRQFAEPPQRFDSSATIRTGVDAPGSSQVVQNRLQTR